jgi:hypothetical protein
VEEEWRTRRGRDSLKHVLVRRLVRAVQQWQDLYGPLTADELDRLWAQARAQLLAADTPPSS